MDGKDTGIVPFKWAAVVVLEPVVDLAVDNSARVVCKLVVIVDVVVFVVQVCVSGVGWDSADDFEVCLMEVGFGRFCKRFFNRQSEVGFCRFVERHSVCELCVRMEEICALKVFW